MPEEHTTYVEDPYTVYVEIEDPETHPTPSLYGTYATRADAKIAVSAAKIAHPNGNVWVEWEGDDEYHPDPLSGTEEIRRECKHYWMKRADGIFYCIHGCDAPRELT